jgi:Prolyl oligopeptidase family
MRLLIYCFLLIAIAHPAFSQPNIDTTVRRIPALGIKVNEDDQKELETGLNELSAAIEQLRKKKDVFTIKYLPDVLIYHKAVDYALKYREFFNEKDITSAKAELKEGLWRADQLSQRKAPWTTQKGEIVRGYISKIDGSVQPYGLTIPENYTGKNEKFNLSLWFHGRGENLSEVSFIANTNSFVSTMPAMKNTIMLYPYGRYCNAFKFAGETDVLEVLEAAKKEYSIRDDGMLVRGFSMGGAAVWQMAVHFPDKWLAANPGAGFAETYEFLQLYKELLHPRGYEKKLWHLYDCTDYAGNLYYLPLIAYSGEIDQQIQAARVMEKAMKQEGLTLTHIIGENTAHSYHKESAKIVDSLLNQIALTGKKPVPKEIHFTTYTLKYNKMYWLTVDALQEHWTRARADGNIAGNSILLTTTNITGLSLDLSVLSKWVKLANPVSIIIDGTTIKINKMAAKGRLVLHKEKEKWINGAARPALVKKHDLQGPVDDAFMSSFIVVRPTGKSRNELFDQWSKAELERFLVQWRRQFRGDAIIKNDNELTKSDLSANLIVFGDGESNHFISTIRNKVPLKWDELAIRAGNVSYSSKTHALIMIYPNPMNPKKYIVLNSGFTFREDAFLNNAKQIPMLPDWAIIDIRTPPGPVYPGKIESAGFFGEHWEWKDPFVETGHALSLRKTYKFGK